MSDANFFAASCDAVSRLGLTSVARMLSETSMASMMVTLDVANNSYIDGDSITMALAAVDFTQAKALIDRGLLATRVNDKMQNEMYVTREGWNALNRSLRQGGI